MQDDIVYVRYPEQDVKYEGKEIDEITLAYAITVHKSQGSEYHTVIMTLVNSHVIMLQRNLLYTAVTRAKGKVILVGTKAALRTAVQNVRTSRRFTLLAQRLREEEYAEGMAAEPVVSAALSWLRRCCKPSWPVVFFLFWGSLASAPARAETGKPPGRLLLPVRLPRACPDDAAAA